MVRPHEEEESKYKSEEVTARVNEFQSLIREIIQIIATGFKRASRSLSVARAEIR